MIELILLLLVHNIGSVKLDQIFRGTPHSSVSLLNKASICSTGLTPKVSENLSYTTFTINKDNSLTLTPVPKPPTPSGHGYYDEPKFHKVDFTPRSTPGLDRMHNGGGSVCGTQKPESLAEEKLIEITERKPREPEKTTIAILPSPTVNKEDEGGHREPRPASATVRNGYEVFVPKPHKTYEEYMPDINAYTGPKQAAESGRAALRSPSSFNTGPRPEPEKPRVIQERSVPVKTLIDTFEHNNRPVMRYLQLEESVPMSADLRRLHEDPAPRPANDWHDSGGYYTADTTVETRSYTKSYHHDADDEGFGATEDGAAVETVGFAAPSYRDAEGGAESRVTAAAAAAEDDKSEFADDSAVTEYGYRSECAEDVSGPFDSKFQTIRQLATPDSLESSMLFARKQSSYDERREYGGSAHYAPAKVPTGKTNSDRPFVFARFPNAVPSRSILSACSPVRDSVRF